jgi:hypothetical protein
VTGPDPVAAIQAAAVDRALVDRAAARDHLALVGALDPARRATRPVDPGTAALLAARAAAAEGGEKLVLDGAAVACRRFGVAPVRAAEAADLRLERLAGRLDR